MPHPNAIVSVPRRLEPTLDQAPADLLRQARGLAVELDDGRLVRLDPRNPRSPGFAQVLDGLSRQRLPAYLELDPETGSLVRLLIPHYTRVQALRDIGGGSLAVELERSHGRHLLDRHHPDFASMEALLLDALADRSALVVTEDDAHHILDVRRVAPGPDQTPWPSLKPEWPPRRREPLGWLDRLWHRIRHWLIWRRWWWWWRCLSPRRAQEVFDRLAATTCNPLSVPPPCIPFLYPDDGCWGRAHEMCRLMLDIGLSPRKVWIEGNLRASTRNNPNCQVFWGWHVAPTLCVRRGGFWWFRTRRLVFDPALFTTPVTQETWKSAQGDPGSTLTASDAEIFYLWGMVTDPSYVETQAVLATYRLQLQNRSLTQGPPPYAHCG
ncbi:protein-glutamine glutaminase family protein [Caldimonas brevitalea]|uniref:Protein glutaminase domain-containing protein n=1 Tax=Caldimonas brevitalea TaxID=413882 RepID=A0A0G3BZN4_9BURK|nr:protein-glutamine glutaminase family protein [Caldimonas brevitalea]AKJ32005.1 hypothetical protein AAW51_5314 [Caldimonas brevitalea]